MIKLHSLTAESPPAEACVTFQNKHVSPSILGGNTGERADTGGAEETAEDAEDAPPQRQTGVLASLLSQK